MANGCPRCGAAAPPGAAFCPACGNALEPAVGEERKLATLVFADLVGSTELVAGRDPEEMRRMLAPFYDLARATLEEHGGRVEKFIGDAVVAVFGVPRAHGDDPDRAVAAGLALVERLADRSDSLELRIGIEAGEVLASEREGDLAITGDASHAAARLQAAAAPGEVLVGTRAAAAARRATLGERRLVEAKGFPEPLEAQLATGAGEVEPAPGTPFVGRGGELETLRLAYLGAVRERAPRLALIVGEAGAGKTRLVRETLTALAAHDPAPLVLTGRNPPYGDGIAFWALAGVIRDAAGLGTGAGVDEARSALERRLAGLGAARPAETAQVLASTLTGADAEVEPALLRRAWRNLVAALAAERPVVIAVDDVHWADEGFLDKLDDAAELPSGPVLVLCTARPEIDERRPELAAGGRRERVELGPLPAAASEELAARLLAGAELDLVRRIARNSGGNPFFAEEIAHAIAADGGLGSMPDTVQAAIASRLDSLPADQKRAIQRAAVLGDRFGAAALAELTDGPPDEALGALERRGLIESREVEEPGLYAFHHQLIRDVAYASLTRAERIRLHELAAEALVAAAGERFGELAEVIAFHRARAAELGPGSERAARAFDAAVEASAIAARRGAPARAQRLLEQAAGFAASPRQRIEALTDAAVIALSRIRGDEGYRLFSEAAALAEEAGEAELAAGFYGRAVEIGTRMGGISGVFSEAEMRSLLDHAESLVPEPDLTLAAQLKLDEGWIEWRFERERNMGATARQALELARRADDPRLLSSALDAASAATWTQGRFAEAAALNRERLDALSAEPDSPLIATERSDAISMVVEASMRAGDLRVALEWDAVNEAEIADRAPHIAGARSVQPLYHLGEWDAALERATRVRESWYAEGRPPFVPYAPDLAVAAAICGLRGDEAAHRDWLAVAYEVAADSQQAPGVRLFEADVLLHLGDLDRAIALLEPLEPVFWWYDPVLSMRAEAFALAGHPKARAMLERAYARETDDQVSAATRLRARGVLDGDRDALLEAAERLERLEFVYQAARTRWLLGGEHRAAAGEVFARLGAVDPA